MLLALKIYKNKFHTTSLKTCHETTYVVLSKSTAEQFKAVLNARCTLTTFEGFLHKYTERIYSRFFKNQQVSVLPYEQFATVLPQEHSSSTRTICRSSLLRTICSSSSIKTIYSCYSIRIICSSSFFHKNNFQQFFHKNNLQ